MIHMTSPIQVRGHNFSCIVCFCWDKFTLNSHSITNVVCLLITKCNVPRSSVGWHSTDVTCQGDGLAQYKVHAWAKFIQKIKNIKSPCSSTAMFWQALQPLFCSTQHNNIHNATKTYIANAHKSNVLHDFFQSKSDR